MSEVVIPLIYLSVIALYLFIFPFIDPDARKVTGYRKKLAAYDEKSAITSKSIFRWLDLRIVLVAAMLIGAYLGTYLSARSQAFTKTEYLIPSGYPNAIVIRIYGDKVVCAYYNPQTKIVETQYFVLNLTDLSKPGLTLTKTGQLLPPNY
jgi:hypothetical protein